MSAERVVQRIDSALARAPAGLWPFLPAGYPNIETTAALLRRLGELPIRGVEIGFPFSDPIADGPVIQHAFTHALAAGVRVEDVFDMVRQVRPAVSYPLVGMVSASIVFRIGSASFIRQAAASGLDGLILPDLSLEEAPQIGTLLREAGLRLCMLIAPTTPAARQKKIAEAASGFLYYVSVQGVTGERARLAADLEANVRRLRAETGARVLVGFGISSAEHVRAVCGFADGAIVGSAIVQKLRSLTDEGLRDSMFIDRVGEFVAGLGAGAVQRA